MAPLNLDPKTRQPVITEHRFDPSSQEEQVSISAMNTPTMSASSATASRDDV